MIEEKAMDLEARKISFVQEFLRLQNEEIVDSLEQMLRKRKAEQMESNLQPMSEQQLNDEVDQALEDSKKERLTTVKDLRHNIQKWS
ncbi:MAG: hypothetical protein ABJF04_13270 [Reichenbachiella sp.]|uniref:hypothetical protein n=1 Tax=Reichenbachiella sp. TaxID=2184521 RepID=UPI003264DD8A